MNYGFFAHVLCGWAAVLALSGFAWAEDAPKDAGALTPLQQAAKDGNLQAVTDLLAKGADVNAATEDGKTPLHLAAAAAPRMSSPCCWRKAPT